MHELGVVFHIADSVVKIAQDNQAQHVRRVTLQIGEVSTVIPDYLIDVWKWNCKRNPMLEDCELLWGSDRTYLQQGNELEIKEIAIE